MNYQRRLLTSEEAGLIEQAAERWLRMRDVELNAGEEAHAVLAAADVRPEHCTRQDIATLGRTLLLEVPGEPQAVPITLVVPREEDLWRGRVSLLSELGLACIGQVQGSAIRLARGVARLVGFGGVEPAPNGSSREARHAHA